MKTIEKDMMIFGNVHTVDNIMNGDKDIFIIIEKEHTPNEDNTLYFAEQKFEKREKAYILENGELMEVQDKLSAKNIVSGEYELMNRQNLSQKQIVPLFYLKKNEEDVCVYSQLRFTVEDAIFIKTGCLKNRDMNIDQTIRYAISLYQKNFVFLGNHQCYYRKMDSKKEIEYKFNIIDNSDPWLLICELMEDMRMGKIDNYIYEYKDEFQKWDYMNYMFKINGNEDERGYISFIPQTNGNYLIKRKIYQQDQLSRTEIHYKNVEIKVPLNKYIEEKFKLYEYVEFAPFRRVRYDINIECCKTGNVHGIFFDYITINGHKEILKQCEIEYLRTRSLYENTEYQDELLKLKEYMVDFFKKRKINFEETFFSKLSFVTNVFEKENSVKI